MVSLEEVYQQIRCIKSRPNELKSFEEIQKLIEKAKVDHSKDSLVYLLEAYNFIRIGCFEEALNSVASFFDYYENCLPKKSERRYERRYSTLKHGLVLVATLHRFFGSYLAGSALLTQASANAHDNHDVSEYRFCMLEERAYNLNAMQSSMNTAFKRNNDSIHYLDELNKRFLTRFHSDQMHLPTMGLEEAFKTFIAAGFAHKSPRFKAIAQHFRIGLVFINALHSARRCEDSEKVSKYLNVCLENEIASQWRVYSNDIEDGAMAIQSTLRLSSGCTALEEKLRFTRDEHASERVTEGELIMGVNAAYAYAYEGNFKQAIQILERMKLSFPSESNPMLAIHRQLAEQCILFDMEFFKGEFDNCEERLSLLYEYSKPEYTFRKCLLNCAFYNHDETELTKMLSLIHKSSDPHLKIRTRIALGNLKIVNGNFEDGLAHLERAAGSASKLNLTFFEAAAKRRMAYAYICRNDFQKAEALLKPLENQYEDEDVVCIEKFLYYATWLELYIHKARTQEITQDEKIDVIFNVMKAVKSVSRKGFTIIEAELYRKAAIFMSQTLDGKQRAISLANRRETTKIDLLNCFNYFVL
ncbi:unnamed protein product [Bursaphelenchus okinawaensis]|uniref:Anaphase-promoting complex subunit 5 n=1 Tax=Bursaphelenchus okinawaensis TaxID=465554 RepID=A0A811LLQ5_9BILA|nr:unnamed protein product [Bursaphelenchus okinawaensis]CAG9125988.1 unnamed protein product [Bursaphelenchus okinawaensis]